MNSKQPASVRDRILAKIERHEVVMHSRAFFALKIAIAAAIACAALVLSVFIGALVFFIVRLNGHDKLLALGRIGLFARVFPWWTLGVDLLLCIALVWLVRRFQFGYRTPILSVFFAMVVLALVAGYALDSGTALNDHLLRDADDGVLPAPLRGLYQGTRRPPPPGSAYRGLITSAQPGSFMLNDPDLRRDFTVHVTPETDLHVQPAPGESVFVIGPEKDGVIKALDVHPIDPDGLPPHGRDDDFPF